MEFLTKKVMLFMGSYQCIYSIRTSTTPLFERNKMSMHAMIGYHRSIMYSCSHDYESKDDAPTEHTRRELKVSSFNDFVNLDIYMRFIAYRPFLWLVIRCFAIIPKLSLKIHKFSKAHKSILNSALLPY